MLLSCRVTEHHRIVGPCVIFCSVESPPETGRTNGDSDSILLKKIYGLQKSNCEIIERVESVKNVESYSYKLQISETFEVSVNETHHVQDGTIRGPFWLPVAREN